MPKKDKDNASSNKKRHSKVENGKDKDEVVCIGQSGKLFSCDNDSMVACDRCSQFTCIECLGMSEEQYKLMGEIWCTVICNNCRPIGIKEMKRAALWKCNVKNFCFITMKG